MTAYGNGQVIMYGKSHVTTTPGPNHPEVGTIMQDGDEQYIWVYNVGSSTVNIGHGCTVSAVTGYSVTVSSITAVDFLVGVCKHANIATGDYGWLLQRGFTSVEMGADNSAAVGVPLCLALDGTFAHKSNATDYRTPLVGKAMEAIASGASGQAFVRCF